MATFWTKKDLENVSDVTLINDILQVHAAKLKKYSPLDRKIKDIQNKLRSGSKINEFGMIEAI